MHGWRRAPWALWVTAALCACSSSSSSSSTSPPPLHCASDERAEVDHCAKNYAVRLNSVGYLPGRAKRASFAGASGAFQIVASDGSVALSGVATGPLTDVDTQELLWVADFSTFSQTGTYHVAANASRSPDFTIDPGVYDGVLTTLMLGMYGQRCGTALSFSYGGDNFAHDTCHLSDAELDYFPEGAAASRPGAGGWHDAGEYGKYVNNAAFSVATLLYAWQRHPAALASLNLPIPEHGGPLPDFLAECKWELDWLSEMQMDDGSVSDRITTASFDALNLSPSASTATRRFAPVSTAATADFAATLALAARVYQAFDAALAQSYADAASRAYAFLLATPDPIQPQLSTTFTGGYQSGDADDRLWAAADWELTGDASALADTEQRLATKSSVNANFDWADLTTLAQLSYALSARDGRNATLLAATQQAIIASANTLSQNALDPLPTATQTNGYGRDLYKTYFWGINGALARTALVLAAANTLSPNPRYLDTASLQLDHLLGRNYYGRSFVTGLGFDPPRNPHHRPSIADSVQNPWPGLLVGGSYNDDAGTLKALYWQDDAGNPQTNGVAINWSAALIYAAALVAR